MTHVVQGLNAAAVAAQEQIKELLPLIERAPQNFKYFIKPAHPATGRAHQFWNLRGQIKPHVGLDQRFASHSASVPKRELVPNHAAYLYLAICSRVFHKAVKRT